MFFFFFLNFQPVLRFKSSQNYNYNVCFIFISDTEYIVDLKDFQPQTHTGKFSVKILFTGEFEVSQLTTECTIGEVANSKRPLLIIRKV